MKAEIIDKINQEIYKQFPYLKESEPEISAFDENTFRLVYRGEARTENGFIIAMIIRVVADLSGKVLKLTTSR